MDNKLIISVEAHDKKYSAELSDEASWLQVLDSCLALLQTPDGYIISQKQLIEWAKDTEYTKEGAC